MKAMASMTKADSTRPSRRSLVRDHVVARVNALQRSYLNDESAARSTVASLRASLNAPIGQNPAAYAAAFDQADPTLFGRLDEPSAAEDAIHVSLGLYALHQQSRRDSKAHVAGATFGAAIAQIARSQARDSGGSSPIMRRFAAASTATNFKEVAHHLRGLVQQLRAERIPLDYGQIALDFYDFHYPEARNSVRLRWNRDVHRPQRKREASETSPAIDQESLAKATG